MQVKPTLILTLGVEGSGHHGISKIIRKNIPQKPVRFRQILYQTSFANAKFIDDVDFQELLVDYTKNINSSDIIYEDDSYPSGLKKRQLHQQKQPQRIILHLKKFFDLKIIHLRRNLFSCVNSRKSFSNSLLEHAILTKLMNDLIHYQISIFKLNNVDVFNLEYEDPSSHVHILANLLNIPPQVLQKDYDEIFKASTKDYRESFTMNEIKSLKEILYPA